MKEHLSAKQTNENYLAGQFAVIAFLGLLTLALNPEQRRAIRDKRDERICQFPHPHGDPCNGHQQLEVHHIKPQRYLKNMGIAEDLIDHPHNLITICQRAHHNHIHPDMLNAKANYYNNKDSYKETFEKRDELAKEGVIYWNPKYDDELKIIAKHQTRVAKIKGWMFPQRNRRNNG